jgi:hypothetical protein
MAVAGTPDMPSVVIPAHNEEGLIAETVQHLAAALHEAAIRLLFASANDYQLLCAALALICLLFILFECSKIAKSVLKSQQLFWIVATLGIFLSLTYACGAVLYLVYPNYIDHGEPTVAAISWLGVHGHPIYPGWQTEDIYEVPYGPLLFITIGTVLRFVPTILGSKLAGWTAFVVALALSYISLKSRASNKKVVFLFFTIVVVQFSLFRFVAYPFWSRPEPFLSLIGVLTIIAILKLPKLTAAIVVGILAGLAVGFKIHGALYAVPAMFAVCGGKTRWRDRIGLATLSLIAATVVAGFPFLAGEASVEGYKSVLLMSAKQGLSLDVFKSNLLFALVLLSPIVFVLYFRRPTLDATDRWFIAGLFASLAVTTLIASKPGAGTHHLLPFITLSAYGLLSVSESPNSKPVPQLYVHAVGILVLVPLLLFYSPGALWWTKIRYESAAKQETENQKIQELEALYTEYPLAECGLSDNEYYADTFYRTLLVFRGKPLRIDFVSWMDLQYAGVVSEMRIIRLLEACNVPVWILPKGDPFTMINYYTLRPLFSDEFRRTFFANYSVAKEGVYYRVWRCRLDETVSSDAFSVSTPSSRRPSP